MGLVWGITRWSRRNDEPERAEPTHAGVMLCAAAAPASGIGKMCSTKVGSTAGLEGSRSCKRGPGNLTSRKLTSDVCFLSSERSRVTGLGGPKLCKASASYCLSHSGEWFSLPRPRCYISIEGEGESIQTLCTAMLF